MQNLVTPEYFATVGIPVLQGRIFTDHDDAAAPAVGIISRTLAERTSPARMRSGARCNW